MLKIIIKLILYFLIKVINVMEIGRVLVAPTPILHGETNVMLKLDIATVMHTDLLNCIIYYR